MRRVGLLRASHGVLRRATVIGDDSDEAREGKKIITNKVMLLGKATTPQMRRQILGINATIINNSTPTPSLLSCAKALSTQGDRRALRPQASFGHLCEGYRCFAQWDRVMVDNWLCLKNYSGLGKIRLLIYTKFSF